MEKASADVSASSINLVVKFMGRNIPVALSPDSTVKDLKFALQPLTNVLPRGQKLIFKGKVLNDTVSLKSSQVSAGSKVMLMASHGLHQGEGPITREVPASSKMRTADCRTLQAKAEVPIQKTRLERWKVTGVVALSECCLKVIPEEVWICGKSIRVLDISNNSIQELPAKIGSLVSLQKLLLHANEIMDGSISFEVFSSLKFLTVLSLNQNQLTTLPPALGGMSSLHQLHIANNKLTSLPDEIGLLTQLQLLKANNNRISTLPSSIGNCGALVEVDFSSNLLAELPQTFGTLSNLKTLMLNNNPLKSLPPTLFKMCSQLSTLDLHRTEITNDVLRQFEGWEAFDERRRSKHQKQLDFRVGCASGFDEGADENNRPNF
ncbi:hypothetical protein H6P81_006506 [Aristolochia fimbriata]|uniref:Ubiquitin-like domain-containing protein n=1 Tax=Aristolochia fimbriata TaxID=158543 RepID=A0AAV7F1D8_ARIFI|nr:hypothetical protein H6P81_006506 [Aristolochia fimbriata]